jgi:hypothetical protein
MGELPSSAHIPDFLVFIPDYDNDNDKQYNSDDDEIELRELSKSQIEKEELITREMSTSTFNHSDNFSNIYNSYNHYSKNKYTEDNYHNNEINKKLLLSIDNKLERMLLRFKKAIDKNTNCLDCFCRCLSCSSFVISLVNWFR